MGRFSGRNNPNSIATPQCEEGHATCEGCARKAERSGGGSNCPVCRGRVNRSKRIRNRLVEQAIDAIEFDLGCRYTK